MAVETYGGLDKLVDEEMKKVPLPPTWNAGFTQSYAEPGQGHFTVTGEFNNARFIYTIEYTGRLCVNMQKDDNTLIVHATKDRFEDIKVNDRYYSAPLPGAMKKDYSWQTKTEAEEDRDEALAFGERMLDSIGKYLQKTVPQLMELILNGYYSRGLMTPESQPQNRSNAEIFAKFDLSVDKPQS